MRSPRERRLFVTCADPEEMPLDRFLPALAGVLGPGAVLVQRTAFADTDRIMARAASIPDGREGCRLDRRDGGALVVTIRGARWRGCARMDASG